MYPTISHLLYDVFGINIPLPVQTFGFFVATAFLAAAWILTLELKRKEKQGLLHTVNKKVTIGEPATIMELILNGLLGFVLGFKLVKVFTDYSTFVADPQHFLLSDVGSLWGGIIGALLFGYLKYAEKQKTNLDKPRVEIQQVYPHQLIGDIIMIAMISGIIGAKLFHNLEYIDDFIADPVRALVSFSGLTFYGGLIFGYIAIVWWAKKHKMSIIHLHDVFAPALMLSYGIGRMGCHLSGDGDWGITNNHARPALLSWLPDWAWAYTYPHNVIGEGVPIPGCVGKYCSQLPEAVYPTAFFEFAACLFLFGILWTLRKRVVIPGLLFSIYLIFNGLERFLIEKIRVNSFCTIFGMHVTQAELISFFLIIAGILSAVYFIKKHKTLKDEQVPLGN